MTIDRLLSMLHIIADYSESYRRISFSFSEVKSGSHKEVSLVELYLDGCVKNLSTKGAQDPFYSHRSSHNLIPVTHTRVTRPHDSYRVIV